MPVRTVKPITPGQRGKTISTFEEITKSKPEKSLTRSLKKSGGRNNMGRVTSRRRGGGHKRKYRIIDFKRDKFDIPAKVAAIEYDPNRSARIALLHYADGEKRYMLSPYGLKVGDTVSSGDNVPLRIGNCLPSEKYSIRSHGAQYRIGARPWRTDGEKCRNGCSNHGKRCRYGNFKTSIQRNSFNQRRLFCHHW